MSNRKILIMSYTPTQNTKNLSKGMGTILKTHFSKNRGSKSSWYHGASDTSEIDPKFQIENLFRIQNFQPRNFHFWPTHFSPMDLKPFESAPFH